MLVLVDAITPRLEYITDFAARELGINDFTFTLSKQVYAESTGPKMNYSTQKVDGFHLEPHTLLFEEGIRKQEISSFEVNGNKAFFQSAGDFPFDIFAASFYLLSRYEEYLPHRKDIYGRFAHEQSLAFKEGFLTIPLVNYWYRDFRESLRRYFPGMKFNPESFTFLPTYDIDEAFSFKHKGRLRTWGGKIRDLLTGRRRQYSERSRVLEGKLKDPYDAFDEMNAMNKHSVVRPIYFFLVGAENGKFDRHILPAVPAMQELIKTQAKNGRIGLHPSWRSGDEPGLISSEKSSLEKIADTRVIASRQHYIRFKLPETYRKLHEAGIAEEYSMGYGSINGFRASVCSPFFWYDLEQERQAPLTVYPFCYMDANSFYEQKLTASQALEEIRHYYRVVKEVNGVMITIWHNTFLGTAERFRGWKDVYEKFLKEVQ